MSAPAGGKGRLVEAGNRLARCLHEALSLTDAEWMRCEEPPCPGWRDALEQWDEAQTGRTPLSKRTRQGATPDE
jgi:hypothetical protein